MEKKRNQTDTMPDVMGAIEAARRRDPGGIRSCNKIGEPIAPSKE